MKKKGFTLIELMIVIAIIAILAAILVPNFLRARAQGQFTACQSNMKNIGTALEMYSVDHQGEYPADLTAGTAGAGDKLMPDYMATLPQCPAASADTYAGAYVQTRVPADAYSFRCTGGNHTTITGTGTEFPQYSSAKGLTVK
jgi:prepilin-type N-terminal cleavage/methylation domain-containing protein